MEMGVAQNSRASVTQVLVFGSTYQGAILGTGFLSHSQMEGSTRRVRKVESQLGLVSCFPAALGVDSRFFSTIVLFQSQPFSRVNTTFEPWPSINALETQLPF